MLLVRKHSSFFSDDEDGFLEDWRLDNLDADIVLNEAR
jgi:hypothetical protein